MDGYPLLLPADMLAAKHLAVLCGVVPILFGILFLLSLRYKQVAGETAVLVCGITLAVLYGLFSMFLVLSFETTMMIQNVMLDEARKSNPELHLNGKPSGDSRLGDTRP